MIETIEKTFADAYEDRTSEAIRLFNLRPICGASWTTLMRRVRYGGRKGRRARRRLHAAGWKFPCEYSYSVIAGPIVWFYGPGAPIDLKADVS